MSLSTLLEKIAGKQHERRRQRMAGYRDFVAGVATGDEPDADDVERTLAAAGKTLDDLRQDVERYQHRLALKAMVASMPKLEAEQQELRRQVAKADDALADAEQRHNEVTAPLYAQLDQLKAALSDAEAGKRELYHTCDDPDLRQELDALNAEAQRLNEQHRCHSDRAAYMEEKAQSERQRAERELSLEDRDARREVADRYQADAEAARREVKKLEKERSNLDKRRERLEEQMRQA